MPNIKTYDAGEVGLTPSDRGVTAFREAGVEAQRMGSQAARSYSRAASFYEQGFNQLGHALGEVAQTYQNHQDTLATTETMQKEADFDLQQHKALDNILAPRPDPNDPTGQRMIQPQASDAPGLVGDRLQAWKDQREELRSTITNQKALEQFDRNTASSYKAFANKAYAIETDLGYRAAGDSLIKTAQANAGLVYNDPNQLDAQLGKLHSSIADVSTSMNLTADKRAAFQTEFEQKSARALIESAVEGSARLGPNGRQHALDLVNSGKYDQWIGTDKDKLITHINAMDRADRADQNAKAAAVAKQQKEQALARTDQYIQDAMSPQPKMKLQDVLQDPAYANRPDLRREAIGVFETMRKFQQQDIDVPQQVSHATTLDLISKMTSDQSAPDHIADRRAIDQEFIAGHLARKDYTFLLGQLKQNESPVMQQLNKSREDFFKSYGQTLDPGRAGGFGPTALGNQKLYAFKQDAMRQEQQLIKEGKDPNTLYDPKSPNFLGNQMTRYYTSVKEAGDYQKQVEKDLGAVLQKYAPGAATMINPTTAPSGSPLEIASHYLGADEHRDRAALMQFFEKAGGKSLDPATTAWCARFANSVLASAGYQTTGSDMAQSFLKVGSQVQAGQAQPGDIIVFPRGAPGSGLGHVGFIKAIHGDQVEVLAGNQSNRVSVETRSLSEAMGIRRVSKGDVGSGVPTPGVSYGISQGEPYARASIPQSSPQQMVQSYPQFQKVEDLRAQISAGKLKAGDHFRLPDGRIGTVPYPKVPMSQ